MAKRIYQYYVEGQDEKALINSLKSELQCIEAGKVDVFNMVQDTMTSARLRPLKTGTRVVLVYDTDVHDLNKVNTLKKNISILKRHAAVKDVLCIPQVLNLEDALIDSCDIKSVTDITHSKSKGDFKRDFIRCKNLGSRLKACRFDKEKLWLKIPQNDFSAFGNDAQKVKT